MAEELGDRLARLRGEPIRVPDVSEQELKVATTMSQRRHSEREKNRRRIRQELEASRAAALNEPPAPACGPPGF